MKKSLVDVVIVGSLAIEAHGGDLLKPLNIYNIVALVIL